MTDHLHHGLALLNSGDFYQAHEVLEDSWRESSGTPKLFRQALVQIAVAFHHYSTGNLAGARSVLGRAIRNLAQFSESCDGVDVGDLRVQLDGWFTALESSIPPPSPVRVKMLLNPE